jgi:phosphoribosylamine--glycine ligase
MRILGIGDFHGLGDMYWRLQQAGHEVRVFVSEAESHGIFAGMIRRTGDWRAELAWIGEAGAEGLIVCETAGFGAQADALRREGFHVVGGSAFGDRLENDRAFGQAVMRSAGMSTASTHAFDSFAAAIEFLAAHPGRYVYKVSDGTAASTRNYVGELEDGGDLLAVLRDEHARATPDAATHFVLMQHISGVEVGVGAYFNGEEFLMPACIDWEHKRFFPGDLGELTGEMGTVVSYRDSQWLFDATLGRIAPALRSAGHCGYLNINTIVNEAGIWPLEFTSRFGYPGFAICDALQTEGWDEMLKRIVDRTALTFPTRDGYAVGVVLTVPPFPYEFGYGQLSKGTRIFFRDTMTPGDLEHLHYGEVEMSQGGLVTSGSLGYVMVVTGVGETIDEAQDAAYGRVRKVVIPNMRYRNDIGDRLRRQDRARLLEWGYGHA